MNAVEQLIYDHLAAEAEKRPYVEVADLLFDDEPFVRGLADAIFEYFED